MFHHLTHVCESVCAFWRRAFCLFDSFGIGLRILVWVTSLLTQWDVLQRLWASFRKQSSGRLHTLSHWKPKRQIVIPFSCHSALIQNSLLHIKVLHSPCFKDWSLIASRICLFWGACTERKLHVGLDQLTFLHLWNCRRLDSSDERPGIFLCCKLLERGGWKFVHLAFTFIPKSQ